MKIMETIKNKIEQYPITYIMTVDGRTSTHVVNNDEEETAFFEAAGDTVGGCAPDENVPVVTITKSPSNQKSSKELVAEMSEALKDNYTFIQKLNGIKWLKERYPQTSLNLRLNAWILAYEF